MNRTTVGIFIFDNVEVLDFAGPYEVFSRTRLVPGADSRRTEDGAPFRVFTVARTAEPVTATGGLRIVPDYAWDAAPAIDLLVVPGGFGTRALMHDGAVLEWVRRTSAAASTAVATVCTGALIAAAAGLLRGRRATTHWNALDLLASLDAGVTVVRTARVVDDGVVSSGGVASGIDMAFYLVERLHGREVADETARYIEYPRQPLAPTA